MLPRLAVAASGIAAITALYTRSAAAECVRVTPVSHLGTTASNLGAPGRVGLLGGAVVAPFLFAPTGLDHAIRHEVQGPIGGRYDAEQISVSAGYLLPVAAGTAWFFSTLSDHGCSSTTRVAAALTQATLLGAFTSGALKFALGRGYPTGGGDPFARDRLDDRNRPLRFHPGDFGAFPSGHAATTFAFAAALRSTLPQRGVARFLGYPLAALVSYGMLHGDHHWASDLVSGALLGEAIGSATGTAFRPSQPSLNLRPRGDAILPVPHPNALGVAIGGTW